MLFPSILDGDKPIGLTIGMTVVLELLYIAFFYLLVLWVFPFWYIGENTFYSRGGFVISSFCFLFFGHDYWLERWVQSDTDVTIPDSAMGAVLSSIIFIILAVAVFAHKYSLAKVRYLSQQEIQLVNSRQQLTQRELEVSKIELNAYRHIFNTHLTFNTLSHIHSQVTDAPHIATPILLLSEILRYNLKTKGHQVVSLAEEICYIQDYLALYRRIFPGLQVDFEVQGNTNQLAVLPRVFLNYIENALKYGKRNNRAHPISIQFSSNQKIYFSVWNEKKTNYTGVSTGIGLENTYQMLKAYYGNDFTLNISDEDTWYEVQLILPKIIYQGETIYHSPLTDLIENESKPMAS